MISRRVATAAAAFVVSASQPAFGQEDAAARARQDAVYAALLAAPDDAALMREYIQASLALEDNEAVISTLERALLFQPGDARLLFELGAAYFRVGAYPVAEANIQAAVDAGLSEDLTALARRYLDAIADRTARSRITGSAQVGLTATTNANLAPDDLRVLAGGSPATLPESARRGSSLGVRAVAAARHDHDLGRPNLDVWRTDAVLFGVRYFSEDAGDVEVARVATGPRLSLDDSVFGMKARPFLRGEAARQDNRFYFADIAGGVRVSDTYDAAFGAFGELAAGRRMYRDELDGFDVSYVEGAAGGSYNFAPGADLVGSFFFNASDADDDPQGGAEIGVRAQVSYNYDPGLVEAGDLWTVSAYAEGALRRYAEADPAVDPNRRRNDTALRFGAAHRFRLSDGWGVQVDLEGVRRTSNLPNFDFNSVSGTLSVVKEF